MKKIFNKLCDIEKLLEKICESFEVNNKTEKEIVRTWDFGEIDLQKLTRIVEDHIRSEKKK